MRLLEHGYTVAKFFPAEQAGGAALLAALASPLPQMRFCPTGGIALATAPAYLKLPNVMCVGGSWVAPKAAVAAGDWGTVTRLAAEAAALPRG
jgi:2-dehydro-3-deoxyphosphogluconate aldolase/(4S)-4-hydroxy-2-oxoglutarate aldolase